MNPKMNYAKHLASLLVGLAGLMGWLNSTGKNVYAQYYCTLSCNATVPQTGTAGNQISFTALARTLYCEGQPTFKWNFGDGTTSTAGNIAHSYAAAGTYKWTLDVMVDDAGESVNGTITINPAVTNTVKGVSAASFDGTALTAEAIVATFGSKLAMATEIAKSVPLPTSLAGTTVKVKDNAGTERLAPLFFVSEGQINHQIPPGTAAGTATITITSGDGTVSTGTALIAPVAPGLFSANASGQGVPAGYMLRVKADNSVNTEAISRFDAAQSKYITVPIDLGAATDQIFLVLFGTGIRFRSSLSGATAKIGGADAQLLYAGPQGDFVGLDQLNIQVPRSLAGRGEVDLVLTLDGKTSNTVRVNIK